MDSAIATAPTTVDSPRTTAPPSPADAVFLQSEGGTCGCGGSSCHCGGKVAPTSSFTPAFVYVLGRIEHQFPSLAVEKEFVQAVGRADATGLSDRQTLQEVISKPENRYLARQLCFVLSVGGVQTYLLRPRDPADLSLLIESIRPNPRPTDVDLVIGLRGPLAPPEMCNGLVLPMLGFDQLYSFDTSSLVKAVPRPDSVDDEKFRPIAEEVFDRIMQMTDNAGATDEHRALNYLAVRAPAIYAAAAEAFSRNSSLAAVDVRPASVSGARKLVDVIFSFRHRETDVTEKFAARVDVTEEFPFLAGKLAPYYDR